MFSLDDARVSLKTNVTEIQNFFVNKYFPADPSHTPDVYQHDVKAFCILAHAIFEEFVEQISLEIMKHATDSWLNKREFSDALLALCIFYKIELNAESDEDSVQERSFDALRKAIDHVRVQHSNAIFANHGFSLKYLRSILTPVAVDVTPDARYTNSLRTLADARGSYAHSISKSALFTDSKTAKKPMTPETARDIVSDCLELCVLISNGAGKFLPAS